MNNKVYITWEQVEERIKEFENQLDFTLNNKVYGIPNGGMICAGLLQRTHLVTNPNEATVFLDDLCDSGKTAEKYVMKYLKPVYTLFNKQTEENLKNKWLIFPWEAEHPGKDKEGIEDNIIRQLQYIGEDVTREGLLDTPKRIVKSWKELYAGYSQDPKDVFTTFSTDGYNQMVVLKNISFYSMCEHHMLPFFGIAHIAYIPKEKVIGISKLARLLEIYTKRMQIQERIGEQVTSDIMKYLDAQGAACIIEAQHLCMKSRGVKNPTSVMQTSSLKGIFMEDSSTRNELFQMIK